MIRILTLISMTVLCLPACQGPDKAAQGSPYEHHVQQPSLFDLFSHDTEFGEQHYEH